MSSFLVCLLLCFSLHACNAQSLKDFSKGVVKVVNLHDTSIPSEMISPISEELGAQKGEEFGKIEIRRPGASSNIEQKSVHDLSKEEGSTKETTSGNGLIISSHQDLQQTDYKEGLKRQERSILESAQTDTEEAVKSNENDIAEDVVVMDYAQPHRKPPIHNEKA